MIWIQSSSPCNFPNIKIKTLTIKQLRYFKITKDLQDQRDKEKVTNLKFEKENEVIHKKEITLLKIEEERLFKNRDEGMSQTIDESSQFNSLSMFHLIKISLQCKLWHSF